MAHFDPQTLQIVVAAVVAGTLLLQVLLLFAILVGVRKAAGAVREDIDEIRATITPLISETHELLVRVGPRIDSTTDDLAVLAHSLREQTTSIQTTVTDISERVRNQAGRVDVMVTSFLDKTEQAAGFVNDSVAKPMRQLTGALACMKAVVETLRAPAPPTNRKPRADGTQGDSGMFI